MPRNNRYHTVIVPRVPIYAYSYSKKGETFTIICEPIVAFAFYYMEGMNINVPLAMGYDCLEDPSTWITYLGTTTDPNMTFEDWKEEILEKEQFMKLHSKRLEEMEMARRKESGEDLQP